ncbi:MAG: hypothetical protein FJ121_10825 [Deltaproteobacteria bacterium]|nr:hypothetical protein [Deltaproteobacteria bacterium]
MNPKIDELLEKVKTIAQTPYGEMLGKIVDRVFERVEEEYDLEPLSPECLQALDEVEAACKRGDYSQFISWEDFKKNHDL